MKFIKQALVEMSNSTPALVKSVEDLEAKMDAFILKLNGDGSLAKREFETPPSINNRVGSIEGAMWSSTTAPTGTMKKSFAIADKDLKQVIIDLKSIGNDMQSIEAMLDQLKAPHTPGRKPFTK